MLNRARTAVVVACLVFVPAASARQAWRLIPTAPAATRNPSPVTIDQQTSWVWPNGTNRVVLYVHGAGEIGASLFSDALKHPLVTALRRHGYALASADADGTAWGDDQSLQAYVDTIRRLRHIGLTRIYVLCQSMGGLDALRLLPLTHVVAWAGIFPLTNLASIAAPYDPWIQTVLQGNLARYWAQLSPIRVRIPASLPMLFWSSYGDTTVPRQDNTDITTRAARADGAKVRVITTTGDHGDPSNFQPRRLLRFFAAATRTTELAPTNAGSGLSR